MFGKRLKELRESKNLYQKELASELDVTMQTISGWEINRTTPDYDMLVKIANFFNVSVDFLLGNEKKAKKIEDKETEKEALKNALVENGYMKKDEDLTNDELKRLMEFVKTNKKYIKEVK